jgi:hypothetical protein
MPDLRKDPRYGAFAKAHIAGVLDGENSLKDISITGCCVESAEKADIQPGVQYQLEIEPEGAAKIGSFCLVVEQKWMRPVEKLIEIGFVIIASPKGKQFNDYIDYLEYRNSNP